MKHVFVFIAVLVFGLIACSKQSPKPVSGQPTVFHAQKPDPAIIDSLLVLKRQYESATEESEARVEMRLMIIHEASKYDPRELPTELDAFVIGLRVEQLAYLHKQNNKLDKVQ